VKKIFLFILFSLFVHSGFSQTPDTPYVILVSFDGFRYDHVNTYNLPNFSAFIKEGASAEYMVPSYPSKTFPNHYTIVTGLYPQNHGLVDNSFYDSVRNSAYTMKQRDMVKDPFYYGGIPLWELAKNNGLKSASFFWVGSETTPENRHPNYYKMYDGSVPDTERIKQVINWLKLPASERPHFISLYFSVIDDVSHEYGPDSPETEMALNYADSLLGTLVKESDKLKLPVNIIVVSDHGMYPMKNNPENYVDLDSIISKEIEEVTVINNGTHVHIYGEEPALSSIYKRANSENIKYDIYHRENTPAEWHYRNHYRIGDLLLVAKAGYGFNAYREDGRPVYGVHGFDPYTVPEMGAIFYARGPAIKSGIIIPPFQNIHVYPLVAHILGLPIPVIDGSLEVLQDILIE
jgi:alkaline phosphatase D